MRRRKSKGILNSLRRSESFTVISDRVRSLAANAAVKVLFGFAIASLLFTAPWWLLSFGIFDGMPPNEVGDYLGGIAGFVSSTITVVLLYVVWNSERKDDRKATFMTSLMVLLEMHVEERERLLAKKSDDSYFKWFWTVNIKRLLARNDPQTRMLEAKRLYVERYNEVASWFLSVLRVLRYIEDSGQPENEKHDAMKLFRLFCEREEQRALFLLLFMKDDSAESPRLLLKHEFFKYAGFQESTELNSLWEHRLEGWKEGTPRYWREAKTDESQTPTGTGNRN